MLLRLKLDMALNKTFLGLLIAIGDMILNSFSENKIVRLLNFLNLCIFLKKGQHPSLLFRLLNIVPKQQEDVQQIVDLEYMNRQLLWQAFTVNLNWLLIGRTSLHSFP